VLNFIANRKQLLKYVEHTQTKTAKSGIL